MRSALLTIPLALTLTGAAALADDSGKATYGRLCASCHAADGRGNPEKAKVLKIDPELLNFGRPQAGKLTPAEMRTILLSGKEKMPAYEKKLKPAEVDPVLEYVLSLIKAIRGK